MGIIRAKQCLTDRPHGVLQDAIPLPAALVDVWAALMAMVARSMERPEAAASTMVGGKHSWIKRSTTPSQACTRGPGRICVTGETKR